MPRRVRHRIRALRVALLAALMVAVALPASAQDTVWQIALTRQSAAATPSGAMNQFRLQLSCSGVAAPSCDGGEVRIPLPPEMDGTGIELADNPLVQGWSVQGTDLVVVLIPQVPAGASTSFAFSIPSKRYLVPNGAEPTLEATVTGSNADPASASASVTITAQDDFVVDKRNPGNLPDGAQVPVNTPVRYTIAYCRTDPLTLGRLRLQGATMVDTLPPGAQFVAASAGGTHAGGVVTWDLGDIDAANPCSEARLWVEVQYPSPPFDTGQSVVNTATLSGTLLGEDESRSWSDDVTHGFGDVPPTGTLCKEHGFGVYPGQVSCGSAQYGTAPIGTGTPANPAVFSDQSTFSQTLSALNTTSVPGTWVFDDALPCLDTPGGTGPYGGTEYLSGTPGSFCQNPALRLARVNTGTAAVREGLDSGAIHYYTTSGERKNFVLSGSYYYPQRGDVVAQVSSEGVMVQAGIRANMGMGFYGADALRDGDSAVNRADMSLRFASGSVDGAPRMQVRFVGEVLGVAGKSMSAGTITLQAAFNDTGALDVPWSHGMVVADLLPLGVTSGDVALQTIRPMGANSFPPGSYATEFIDNYNGTGRTLFRFRVEPGRPLHATTPAFINGNPMLEIVLVPARGTSFPNLASGTTNTVRLFAADGTRIDTCRYTAITPVLSNDTDDWNGDGVVDGDSFCQSSANWASTLEPAPVLSVIKEVQGNADAAFAGFPTVGTVDSALPGGVDYRLTIANGGPVSASGFVAYDVFPHVGDTGVSATQSGVGRQSQWRPTLRGPVTVPAGWQVAYSTASEPCRPEVGNGDATWPAGCVDDWSTTMPGDPATVTAIRLTRASAIANGDSSLITWSMDLPVQPLGGGDAAWNSVAYSAIRDDDGTRMLTSEPPKVGVSTAYSDLSLAKSVSRPLVTVGETVRYTVVLSHDTVIRTDPATGAVNYVDRVTGDPAGAFAAGRNVVVSDVVPPGLTIVPGSSSTPTGSFDEGTGTWTVGDVPVGSQFTLTYDAVVGSTATNTAEITANDTPDLDSEIGTCVVGTDDHCSSATVEVGEASIQLVKYVFDPSTGTYLDAPSAGGSFDPAGEYALLASGAGSTFRFVVTNTSQVPLTDVLLDDPMINGACNFTPFALAPGASRTVSCTWPLGWPIGQHVNTATVQGTSGGGEQVGDSDDAQFLVPTPGVSLVKLTEGVDANDPTGTDVPQVQQGTPVTWTYVVTNTGEEPLHNLSLSDDVETDATFECVVAGTGEPYVLGPTGDPVPVGGGVECRYTGVAVSTTAMPDGVYANVGRVTAQGTESGAGVNAEDPSHYRGTEVVPSVEIVKTTNGVHAPTPAEGPYIAVDDPVTWEYEVTNTGPTHLIDLVVTDDREGVVTCPTDALAPGESTTCTASGTATAGPYVNEAGVVGQPAFPDGDPWPGLPQVVDEDVSHYLGAEPSIELVKYTQGIDVEVPTGLPGPSVRVGDPVQWTYVVTNSGNTPLSEIVLVDDPEGTITCPADTLDPGQSMTCVHTGVATEGVYENLADVTAQSPVGPVTDEDPSAYFGAVPRIAVTKLVQGDATTTATRPRGVAPGSEVVFTYVVTNVGNTTLDGIVLVDDPEGTITCPADVLAVGASMECEVTTTAVAGDYHNTADVVATGPPTVDTQGDPVPGQDVEDDDEAFYRGVTPGVEILKTTQGADANDPDGDDVPLVANGHDVLWEYTVTNVGDTHLGSVAVGDDVEGPATCDAVALAPGESTACRITGAATPGPYANLGSVTATPTRPDGTPYELSDVTDQDPSHYRGTDPAVRMDKSASPAGQVDVGQRVTFTFEVTNTGDTELTQVTVVDAMEGLSELSCVVGGTPVDNGRIVLAAGAVATCEAGYTVTEADTAAGRITNQATVTATGIGGDPVPGDSTVVVTTLQGHHAQIALDKRTQGADAPTATAPDVPVLRTGSEVRWTYEVTNTGTVPLTGVALTDDREGPVPCPRDALDPGEAMTCELRGTAVEGPYENTATVTGTYGGGSVEARDLSHYRGSSAIWVLPWTGAQVGAVLLVGLILVGAGAFLVVRRRSFPG